MTRKIAQINLQVLVDQFRDFPSKHWTQGHGLPPDTQVVAYDFTLVGGQPYIRLVLESAKWSDYQEAVPLDRIILTISSRTEGTFELPVKDETK